MTKKHSYKNPSKARHDLAKVEAQVTEGKKYYDEQGWELSLIHISEPTRPERI